MRLIPTLEMFKKVVNHMSSLENTGRCSRCHKFVIAEELASHACHIPTNGARTIWLDWFSGDGFTDENGDYVRMAKSIKGTLYSFILCKHNPPHSLESQWLNGRDNTRKPPPDKLAVYL